jgi:hypothetical protein
MLDQQREEFPPRVAARKATPIRTRKGVADATGTGEINSSVTWRLAQRPVAMVKKGYLG